MNAALQYSGGRDSLACLYLLEPIWPDLYVVWMNTGAAFPETLELMDRINQLVPHFVEVKGVDVIADIAENGWPADVVPTLNTPQGGHLHEQSIRLRSWAECCGGNLWAPLAQKMRDLKVTTIYRGQRNAEVYKGPVRDGIKVGGVTYRLPLEDWTLKQVTDYLHRRGVPIPEYYQHTETSLDCWCCTAYLDTKASVLPYLKSHHPHKHALVHSRLAQIKTAIARTYQPLSGALT